MTLPLSFRDFRCSLRAFNLVLTFLRCFSKLLSESDEKLDDDDDEDADDDEEFSDESDTLAILLPFFDIVASFTFVISNFCCANLLLAAPLDEPSEDELFFDGFDFLFMLDVDVTMSLLSLGTAWLTA